MLYTLEEMRVTRLDYTGRFDASRRTPQGGLKLPAYVTRTGVLSYRQPNGSVVRELRHPDDVFKEDSLASLAGAPVTVGHPGKVSPDNHSKVAVGHVGDKVEPKDDKYVATTLRVQDAKAVGKVESGELLELSCGYDCDSVPEKGEYKGEKYDARQTNIVYNHVALLPRDAGRAGNDVRIRFDGLTEDEVCTAKLSTHHMDEFEKKIAALTAELADQKVKKEAAKARADALEKELVDTKKAAETLRGENDGLKSKVAELSDPKRMDAAVTARVKLHEDAESFGVEPKGSEREVMVACLTKADASFRADEKTSDDYIRGRFEAEVASTAKGRDSLAKVREDAGASERGSDKDPVQAARLKNETWSKNAWKGN